MDSKNVALLIRFNDIIDTQQLQVICLSHCSLLLLCRHGAALRRAAVAEFEVRLRVPDSSGAWRLVVSLPTGQDLLPQYLSINHIQAEAADQHSSDEIQVEQNCLMLVP